MKWSRALRTAGAAVVVALALTLGVGAGPAAAFCDSSLCGTPEGLAVLGDSDAFTAGLGNGVALSDALAASSAAAGGTAALTTGVGGITFGEAVGGGIPVIFGGAVAAFVGSHSWAAGLLNIAPGGATGVTGSAGGNRFLAGTLGGWWGASGGGTPSSPASIFYTSSAVPLTGGVLVSVDIVVPSSCPSAACRWESSAGGSSYGGWGLYGSTLVSGQGQGEVVNTALTQTTTGWHGSFTVPAGVTLGHVDLNNNGSWLVQASASAFGSPLPAGGATVTRSLTCTNGTTTVVVTQGISVNLGGAGSYSYPVLNCPDGFVVKTFKADLTPSTGGAAQSVIPEVSTPAEVQSIPTEYPNCVTDSCLLRLFKLQPAGTPEMYCGDLGVACPDWYLDPNRASDYECRWGEYVVATDRCSVYRQPGQILPNTLVNPDGTTTYQPWPPEPAPAASSEPAPSSQDCWANGWSSPNPLEWVFVPIKCALTWAFVPQTTPERIDTIKTDLNTRAPAVQIESLFGWLQPPTDTSSSCLVWTLPVWIVPGGDIPVLNSCDPNDPMVKAVSPHRTLLGIAVWVSMLAPLAWWAWKEYAPGAKGVA